MSTTFKQKFGVAVIVGMLLVAALAAFYFLVDPHVRRDNVSHFKLTAEFEVDGRPVTVSQVYGYSCASNVPAPGGEDAPVPCALRGEALRADFGSHGQLFLLMNAWTPDGRKLAGHDALVRGLLAAQAQRKPVAQAALPVMVHFKDPNDPKSVEALDPARLDQGLSGGVRLKSVTVTDSSQPTQYGSVAPALPWLAGLKGDRLDREGEQNALAYRLHGFDFVWAG